jgi:hypothetical protein
MALRDQPYLPLFVQDFLTDEKLMECSAAATGVYIRIMCVMHKSEVYGKILLKQKDKQSNEQVDNFASKLVRHMPFDLQTILVSLKELLSEGCLYIDGDFLIQKRMLRDGEISLKRSESGRKGGVTTQNNVKEFALAKTEANTENAIEINNSINSEIKEVGTEASIAAAKAAWDDQRWREQICLANYITIDQLKQWMYSYNASIANDIIQGFSTSKYKKMFDGWLKSKLAKGVKIPDKPTNGASQLRTL